MQNTGSEPQTRDSAWMAERRIGRQTFWLATISGLQLAGGLAHIFLATRILGVAGYGSLAIVMAISALVHGLVAIPGSDTVTTFATRGVTEGRPEEASAVVRYVTAVSFGLSLIAYVLLGLIALLAADLVAIDGVDPAALLVYALVGVAMAHSSMSNAVLRMADSLGVAALVALASNIVRVGILGIVWRVGGDILAVVAASTAGAAVNGLGLLIAVAVYARRAGIEGVFRSASLHVPRDTARFHGINFGRTAVATLSQQLDTILLAQFIGAAEVGLYRAARHIVDTARQPFRLLRGAVQPVISRLWYAQDGLRLRSIVGRFTLLSVAVAVVGFSVLAVYAEPIALLFLGPEFAGVGALILILIPSGVVTSLAVLGALPLAVGRALPSFVSLLCGLAALAGVVVLLVPQYGAAGGAWARTAAAIVSFLVLLPIIVATLRQSRERQSTSFGPGPDAH